MSATESVMKVKILQHQGVGIYWWSYTYGVVVCEDINLDVQRRVYGDGGLVESHNKS